MHQSESSSPSATLRKMQSFQMIGVAPLQAGVASFHVMFSSVVHLTGRFFSELMPLSAGPRHCGQLSASARATRTGVMTNASSGLKLIAFLHVCSFLRTALRDGSMVGYFPKKKKSGEQMI